MNKIIDHPLFKRLLPPLLLILVTGGIIVSFADTDGDGKRDTITIRVDGIDADHAMDDKIILPADAAAEANPEPEQLEADLKDVSSYAKAAAPDDVKAQAIIEQRVKDSLDPLPTAGASQGFPGCRTTFVRNQSSRNGIRPIWQVLHYTVSPNRPGWDDVFSIVAFFNNPANQASSHFIIDREGNCAYIVPIEAKAWTNAAGNSLSIQYEIINTGSEASFMDTPGYNRLRAVMQEVERRTGIPTARGSVSPVKRGSVQHADGGLAWGGHHDITPFSLTQVLKIINAPIKVPINNRDRATCRKVAAYRDRRRAHKPATKQGKRRQAKRVEYTHNRRHRCSEGKVHHQ